MKIASHQSSWKICSECGDIFLAKKADICKSCRDAIYKRNAYSKKRKKLLYEKFVIEKQEI